MKSVYSIKAAYINGSTDEIRTVFTSTRKREIEAELHRMAKRMKRCGDSVAWRNLGCFNAIIYGTYGYVECDYWIERA